VISRELKEEGKMNNYSSLAVINDGLLLASTSGDKRLSVFDISNEVKSSPERCFDVNAHVFYLPMGGITVVPERNTERCTIFNLAVCSFNGGFIQLISPRGDSIRRFTKAPLRGPNGIAIHKEQVFVCESHGNCISVLNMEGDLLYRFGSKGDGPGSLDFPHQLCVGPDDCLYVSDMLNHRVQVLEKDGTFVRQFGQGILKKPMGLQITKSGYVVVTSNQQNKVSFFTVNGKCVHEVTDVGLFSPCGLAIDQNGFIYVADNGKGRIVKF
jgi:DNA-binding beta-propeller fold protein YncE